MSMPVTHPGSQWFPAAKFGMFIHWGPYSLRGVEASWPLQPYSDQHLPMEEYEALALDFKPDRYEPEEWARLAKEAGAQYVVLTAKHHDGYCLFHTETTDYCATRTGPGVDLIAPYVEALRTAGLKVGFYFTTIDWHDPDFATIPIRSYIQSPKPFQYDPQRWHLFHQRFMQQLTELLTNYGHIDLLWFDVPGFGADRWRSHEVKQMLLNLQPHLVINDRLPEAGDYATPEQFIPHHSPNGWWETCMTLNDQWAYHPDASTYKDVRTLIRTLTEVVHKGGNLLLNVGPKPDGTIPEEAVERFQGIGKWMRHSGSALHDTHRAPQSASACFYGPVTVKGNTVFLHVLDIPQGLVELRGVGGEVESVKLMSTEEPLSFHVHAAPHFWASTEQRIYVELPPERCDPYNTVIAINFAQPPVWP